MAPDSTDKPSSRGRYVEVLERCRDMALIFSNTQLSELLDQTGAAFLDFAERAENNRMQGQLFEAMGIIQRRRLDIEHSFRRQITQGFDDFGHLEPPSRDLTAMVDSDELSLVEPDEMEESIAEENLIVRANATYFPELYALSQRLAVINNGKKLRDYEIPAGPHHLVHSFRRALRGLELEVRVKIILYALFDKFVIKQAKGLYDELNGSLKAAGILPNLKPVHIRPEQGGSGAPAKPPPPPGASESPASTEPPTLGAELFDSIVDLMSTRRTRRRGGRPAAPVDPAVAAATSRELVSALSDLQSHSAAQPLPDIVSTGPGGIPNLEIDVAFIERVKQTLSQEREQALSRIDQDKLAPMDADLIDLIGMLFEYMLNDPVLPNLAKALLSHLHTPYLKVALIDRRLLVDARHPARRLLDQMVEAGSLWIDESKPERGIFPAMQRTVDRVLQEFKDDVSLFNDLLSSFEGAMSEQQRRTDTLEQRTQDAAKGREKLQLARERAGAEIARLTRSFPLPPAVSDFLAKPWLDHLVFILLRDPDEDRGEAWRGALQTAADLTGLFAPDIPPNERRSALARLGDLAGRIGAGVQRMGGASRATLDPLHALLQTPESWQAPASAPPPAPPVAERPAPSPPSAASEQEQDVVNRLRKTKLGTWFELTAEPGGAPRRIKLSWLSPLTSTCMFVDRSGMQAEIKTLNELAQDIIEGRARVIRPPKHPFIERALVSIRKVLKGTGDAPAKAEGSA